MSVIYQDSVHCGATGNHALNFGLGWSPSNWMVLLRTVPAHKSLNFSDWWRSTLAVRVPCRTVTESIAYTFQVWILSYNSHGKRAGRDSSRLFQRDYYWALACTKLIMGQSDTFYAFVGNRLIPLSESRVVMKLIPGNSKPFLIFANY